MINITKLLGGKSRQKKKKNVFVFIMEKFGIHRIEPGILKKKTVCKCCVYKCSN